MKETKTIQLYPDDTLVNETIAVYESFGWEVITNQRCQEYEGQTRDIITGSSTKHYSTFNKVTFTREKGSAWYDEVVKLENEYNAAGDTVKSYKNRKPVLREVKPNGLIAGCLGLYLYMFFIVPGIIFSIVRGHLKSKYKKQYQKELAEYEAVYPAKITELKNKQTELRDRAEKYIFGKA